MKQLKCILKVRTLQITPQLMHFAFSLFSDHCLHQPNLFSEVSMQKRALVEETGVQRASLQYWSTIS